jgi:GntR family transcriptional regulator/MocR family aminotransferase
MRIPIDRTSGQPLYRQIEEYLRRSILSGRLPSETRLPATRRLAKDLGVNRLTIENAYAGLEADGLVYAKVGSGTYVLPTFSLPPLPEQDSEVDWPDWQQPLQMQNQRRSNRQLGLPDIQHPAPIYFDSGSGSDEFYPLDEIRKVIQAVIRQEGISALGYGEPGGYPPLRRTISSVLASQGLEAHPENILITSGSQQALTLAAELLLRPGDTILVESPTYADGLDLFRMLKLNLVGIPIDEEGMQVDLLEDLIRQHNPKLIYTIPNFHNPTGTCLSGHRRRRLIALADQYQIPIVEDDYVGDLRYEGRTQPALKSLDPGGRVIYISTFSKMLMPALRVGFLVAEGPVFQSLVDFKHASDLATSNLIQHTLEAYISVGRYQSHLRRSCQTYQKRLEAMKAAIRRHLPEDVDYHSPKGGLFIWLRLPEGISTLDLLPLAYQAGVVYKPGSLFFLDDADDHRFMRLNFVTNPPDLIEQGMHRLGSAVRQLTVNNQSAGNYR